MMRIILWLCAAFLLTSCFEDENQNRSLVMEQSYMGSSGGFVAEEAMFSDLTSPAPPPPPMQMMKSARMPQPSSMALDRSKFEGRRIAEKHTMSIQTEADDLYGRYQRDLAKCISLGCEITYSQVHSRGSASLNARLTPENLPVFLDYIGEGKGEILSHQVSTDDRTSQYVDTEARLKNQKALRDRLVKLLDSDKPYKVRDLLEVERELARVQGEIDSLTGQIRSIEQVTARATVNVSYSIPPKEQQIHYHDISDSLRYAWNGFLQSISNVIRFILKTLPWIPVWFIGAWLCVRALRFILRKTGGTSWLAKISFLKKGDQKTEDDKPKA